MRRVILPNKFVSETLTLVFDFTSALEAGGTLINPDVVTIAPYTGVDANAGAMITGTPSRIGKVVTQNLTAGLAGVIYSIIVRAGTTFGGFVSLQGFVAVLPDAASS